MDIRFVFFYIGGKATIFFLSMLAYCAYEARKEKKERKKNNSSGKRY